MNNILPLSRPQESSLDSEADLVRAAQLNPGNFHQLYDRWVTPVYQYLFFQTGSRADAEDITSQVFLSAYQALPRYRHKGRFAGWLFTIARNNLRDFFRKRSREVPLDAAGSLASQADPAAEVAALDDLQRLRRLIAGLADEEQELIRLRYVADLSFADMAAVLGRREDAVKKSLYRLQARMLSLLEPDHA